MKNCEKCGYELEYNWKCCPKCGEISKKKSHIYSNLLLFLITISITIFIIFCIATNKEIFKIAIVINIVAVILMLIVLVLQFLYPENEKINKVLKILKYLIIYSDILVPFMFFAALLECIIDIYELLGEWIYSI